VGVRLFGPSTSSARRSPRIVPPTTRRGCTLMSATGVSYSSSSWDRRSGRCRMTRETVTRSCTSRCGSPRGPLRQMSRDGTSSPSAPWEASSASSAPGEPRLIQSGTKCTRIRMSLGVGRTPPPSSCVRRACVPRRSAAPLLSSAAPGLQDQIGHLSPSGRVGYYRYSVVTATVRESAGQAPTLHVTAEMQLYGGGGAAVWPCDCPSCEIRSG
jgi:hypothetical protein